MSIYHVQYADGVDEDLNNLPDETRESVVSRIKEMASSIMPMSMGLPQGGIPERRRLHVKGASLLVWISSSVRVLTVVEVQQHSDVKGKSLVLASSLADFLVGEDR